VLDTPRDLKMAFPEVDEKRRDELQLIRQRLAKGRS